MASGVPKKLFQEQRMRQARERQERQEQERKAREERERKEREERERKEREERERKAREERERKEREDDDYVVVKTNDGSYTDKVCFAPSFLQLTHCMIGRR